MQSIIQKKLENRKLRQQQAAEIANNQDDKEVLEVVDKLKQSSIKGEAESENAVQKSDPVIKPKASNIATANNAAKVVTRQTSAPAISTVNLHMSPHRSYLISYQAVAIIDHDSM